MKKFIVMFVLLTLLAVYTKTASADVITDFPIKTDAFNKFFPAVSGNYVSWRDNTRGGIYANNTPQGEPIRLGNCLPYEGVDSGSEFGPNMGGNYVVWEENSTTDPNNIHAYNLSTGTDTIIGSGTGYNATPNTDGINAVWVNGGNLNRYNFSTQTQSTIEPDGNQAHPDVDGDNVVWKIGSSGTRLYKVSSGSGFTIHTEDSDVRVRPSISGDYVVWEENYADIHAYNLLTNVESIINTTSLGWREYPAISGHTVVWMDYRNGNSDIYGYNLLTGQEYPVYVGSRDQLWPAIDGNLVVWSDFRNNGGFADIYGAYVPEPATLSLFALTCFLFRNRARRHGGLFLS